MLNIEIIIDTVNPIADQYNLITKVYLFGSYAKGLADEESDVDLLIEVDNKISLDVPAFMGDVEDALGLSVDVVTKRSLSKDFFNSIKDSLVLVYEEKRF